MSTARFADALAALAAAFTAAPALVAVTVTNSPAPAAASMGDFLIAGHDGTLEADGSLSGITAAGRFTQAPIIVGAPPVKEETGQVNCTVVSQTGDTGDITGRLARVQAIVAACEDACTDLKTGGIVFDGTTGGDVRTVQTSGGCAAVLTFAVGYTVPW